MRKKKNGSGGRGGSAFAPKKELKMPEKTWSIFHLDVYNENYVALHL
jgi:hypothetical protein